MLAPLWYPNWCKTWNSSQLREYLLLTSSTLGIWKLTIFKAMNPAKLPRKGKKVAINPTCHLLDLFSCHSVARQRLRNQRKKRSGCTDCTDYEQGHDLNEKLGVCG